MRPHFSDQEARQILDDRKRQRDAEWLRGVIGERTYLVSLQILGYSPNDAKTELNHLKLDQARR
jgi:hypothetical protein